MDLHKYQSKKSLIKNNSKEIGEIILGENMTDIIGYSPSNLTFEDLLSAGYINSMNLLYRIIHDIEDEQQLQVFDKYVLPYYRRNGIDFLDAYNEVKKKFENISENMLKASINIEKSKLKEKEMNDKKENKEQSDNT
jgi:hypothetical protein